MLVLTRKESEVIVLETADGPIRITLVQSAYQARIGIEAPQSVNIYREELASPRKSGTVYPGDERDTERETSDS